MRYDALHRKGTDSLHMLELCALRAREALAPACTSLENATSQALPVP